LAGIVASASISAVAEAPRAKQLLIMSRTLSTRREGAIFPSARIKRAKPRRREPCEFAAR